VLAEIKMRQEKRLTFAALYLENNTLLVPRWTKIEIVCKHPKHANFSDRKTILVHFFVQPGSLSVLRGFITERVSEEDNVVFFVQHQDYSFILSLSQFSK
jgi:hypothetical protein